jgi:cbb3-type cytochrome oxidase maturation protein
MVVVAAKGASLDGWRDGRANVNSIFFLLPIALLLGAIFAFLFVKAVRDGQFDDLDDPPERMLHD